MAIIVFGDIITGMRGHRGGIVYSVNRYGPYAKIRRGPPNKNTALQNERRSVLGYLSHYWATDLNAGERTAWNTYADNTTFFNSLGEPYTASGFNMFLRTNTLRLLADMAILDAAPGAPGHGTNLTIDDAQIAASEATNLIVIQAAAFTNWANNVQDDTVLIFLTPQVSPAGASIRPPPLFNIEIIGDVGAPPAFPFAITYSLGAMLQNNWIVMLFSRIMPDGKVATRTAVPIQIGA